MRKFTLAPPRVVAELMVVSRCYARPVNRLLAIILLCGATQELRAQVVRVPPTPPSLIQPGTTLHIRLAGVPAEDAEQLSSQTYTVANDGSITLPYIGPVVVSGLTWSQAEAAIERTYIAQKIYRHPTIMIQQRPSPFGPRHSPQLLPQLLDAPGPGYREHVKLPQVAISQ